MKKLALLLLAGSLFLISSCSKRGPTGPQGPQGPQGNANVVGSDPFNVTVWSYSSAENAYFASFTDNDITSAVAAHGVVEIFLYYPGDGTWRNLPDIYNGTQVYFRFSQGGFEIYYGNVDGSTPSAPAGTWTFRTVVIAPAFKEAHPNTNWKNYNEVMSVMNEATTSATQHN
jgi:hypothetical protein